MSETLQNLSVGIDVGTSAVKVIAIAEDGSVRERREIPYPLSTPKPGWSEQDPDDWWKATEEALDGLTGVRGIGRWTAEMFLMFELRRLDVWPVDDLGVRQGFGLAWGIDPPPAPKPLLALGDPFRPYRSILARYCWEAVALHRGGTDPSLR